MSRPVIYQLFVRLFANPNPANHFDGEMEANGCGKFNHISSRVLEEIRLLGFTHIWYTGIIEHSTTTQVDDRKGDPQCIVKGKAGSPYAISDYYDVNATMACEQSNRMAEFEALINRTHEAGLKVLIDFVPNHVARSYHSDAKPLETLDFGTTDEPENPFSPANNFYYLPGQQLVLPCNSQQFAEIPAKASGNDCFSNTPSVNDWYETVKLNYGIDYQNNREEHFCPEPDTWLKMNHILRFWADKKIDGFRCDMASMVPVAFWRQAIGLIKNEFPHILFIAEIYEPHLYHAYAFEAGFDYLYDKVGLYDTLRAVMTRQAPASLVSNCWRSLEGLSDKMLNFIENHDEQRIASLHFAGSPLPGIPAMAVAAFINRGAVLVYNGQELGEDGSQPKGYSGDDGRTSIFDYGCMPTIHRWTNNGAFNQEKLSSSEKELHNHYKFLLNLINSKNSLKTGGFYDLMWVNHHGDGFPDNHVFAFLRYHREEVVVVLANFSAETRKLKVKIPAHAIRFMQVDYQNAKKMINLATHEECEVMQEEQGAWLIEVTLSAHGIIIGELTK